MKPLFPGTVVERGGRQADEFLSGVFSATKGLMLAQVREITGLDTPAIQNWINRGWVQKPVNKRYDADQVARIIILNMLRDVMQLDRIAALLSYIDGEPGNANGHIISEAKLYGYLCVILDKADFETVLSDDVFTRVIEQAIRDYREPVRGARKRLTEGIRMILIYYASSVIKRKADELYRQAIEIGTPARAKQAVGR